MTPFNLSEFRRLAEKRTKGPWVFEKLSSEEQTCYNPLRTYNLEIGDNTVHNDWYYPSAPEANDAEFAAYCGTHADAIIERIEKLEKALEFYVLIGETAFAEFDDGKVARKALERGE